MNRVIRSTGRNLSGFRPGRIGVLSVAAMMMMLVSAPAFAQVANPFAGAGSDLQQWIGYGAAAGALGVIILAAIGLGKAVFRRLAS